MPILHQDEQSNSPTVQQSNSPTKNSPSTKSKPPYICYTTEMKQQKPNISFQKFLSFFPEIELPVILTEDAHHEFSKANDALPKRAIEQYILPHEELVYDEYTEYIPCLKIPKTYDFHAVVYFKVSLLIYEYYLATFEKKGKLITKEKIAGMVTHGEEINRAVATIEDDWVIKIVEGSVSSEHQDYKPTDSNAYSMELLPDGQIIFSVNEDIL